MHSLLCLFLILCTLSSYAKEKKIEKKVTIEIDKFQLKAGPSFNFINIKNSQSFITGSQVQLTYFLHHKISINMGYYNLVQLQEAENTPIYGYDFTARYYFQSLPYEQRIITETQIITTIPKFSIFTSLLFSNRTFSIDSSNISFFGQGMGGGVNWFFYKKYFFEAELYIKSLNGELDDSSRVNYTSTSLNTLIGLSF